jgi:hypothetical protein
MVTIRRKPYRKRHRATVRAARQAPASAPTLMSAAYDPGGPTLTLGFDQAVDADAFDGAAITVNDPLSLSASYDGTGGATLVSPTTVEVSLTMTGLPSGTVVTLDATAANGIVASGGGAAWAGVTGLELPWP